ncbi:hypothetical protein GCM10009789_40330 [Kribbella sancticallisti]|uniref:Sialidase domain-containing protein n=1 Tax=Kribbella sancticallisti TaxID=460087 RepID=A0ABP4PM96_9ACTN
MRRSPTRRVAALALAFACTSALLVAGVAASPPAAANGDGKAIHDFADPDAKGLAIRTIRLQHAGRENGTLISTFEHWKPNSAESVPYLIKRSADDGRTWTTLAEVEDGETGPGRPWPTKWTPSLLELPRRVGKYPAGAIFLVGAVTGPRVEVQLWRSLDHGRSWTYGGVVQESSSDGRPIWEPFLYLGAKGELVMQFSDERDVSHSQKLSQVVSVDGGETWGASTEVVAAPESHLRPGMPIVTRLANGRYILSYELVGAPIAADAMVKESADGVNWGDPADLGRRPQTADHRYLASYPYLVWAPGGGPQGQLILTAGYSIDARAPRQTPEQRQSALVSYDQGKTWFRMHLPFKPAECDGTLWGAALLPSKDGRELRLDSPAGRPGSTHCGVYAEQANVGTLPYRADFATGDDPGWVRYAGDWSVDEARVYRQSAAEGGKALAGSTAWRDYRVSAEVRLESAGSSAALLFRVTDPAPALAAHDGYHATVTAGGDLLVGRNSHDGPAATLAAAKVPGGVQLGTSYRLTVNAQGHRLTAELWTMDSHRRLAVATVRDSSYHNGNLGVSTVGAASFDNLSAQH